MEKIILLLLVLMNPLCYHVTHTYNNFWTEFLRLPHTLYSCYLCIRFPFLYPRNRFTGRHYTNWWFEKNLGILRYFEKDQVHLNYVKESDYTDKAYMGGVFYVNTNEYRITRLLKKDDEMYYAIMKDYKYLYTFNTDKLLEKGVIKKVVYLDNKLNVVCSDDYVLKETTPRIILDLDTNTFISKLIKVLNFVYNIISIPHLIPTYSELDEMPRGWRKAFGIRMCKEIKDALKEHDYLYKYRIMQIKEKFGTLRWYDNGSPHGCTFPIINKYEDLSYDTCITCGKKAEYISHGWISPYCTKHVPDVNRATLIDSRDEKVKLDYIIKVINSCKTKVQLKNAYKWALSVFKTELYESEEIYDAYIAKTGEIQTSKKS